MNERKIDFHMCGITGIVNISDCETLARMTDIQAHRGPDDQGVWDSRLPDGSYVGLGSRRLSIQDLSLAGHMPMSTPDGRFTIVYNGEIYNYPALRRELETKGYAFRSHSDTEAILYLYQEYGPACLTRLNGMFAIAIVSRAVEDGDVGHLFLARDHFGVKPLYYWRQGRQLAFASEVKALLQLPEVPRRINEYALRQYLSFLWVPDPLTLFDDIYKLPAGHYALFKDGQLVIEPYWDLKYPHAGYAFPNRTETDLAAELRERFTTAVQSQMLSDVPVGAFLSAGLDSSSIVAAMARHSNTPVRTFTIAFAEKYRRGEVTIDDVRVAQRTAQGFGCEHTEIVVEPDVVSLLPKLVWHMDEPVADPAIITAYLVSREARKDVTVLLSGVGGDELFAGYRKHQAHFLAERYKSVPQFMRRGLIEPMVSALPAFRGTPIKGHVRLAKKMARSGSLPPRERFIADSLYMTEAQMTLILSDRVKAQPDSATLDPRAQHFEYFDRVHDADFLNQMLYLDTKAFMASLNLTYNDKMSMAASVEARVPFLDWQLAEWVAWNIPPHLKLRKGVTKHILREAMKPVLPAEVLVQKKAGFGAPADYWLTHELREMTDDLLSESRLRRRGLFDPSMVQKLLEQHRTGREDWSLQLWQLLTFELWAQTFLDSPDAALAPHTAALDVA